MNVSGQGNWMDKLFHKKLSGFELSPEDHVWESIAKRLDESQKRPALFGNWWTILLSVILLLLVTGAGAFMLYKKYYPQKIEKNQNKDLPYLNQKNYEDVAVTADPLEINTIPSDANQTTQVSNKQKKERTLNITAKNEIKDEATMLVTTKGNNSDTESKESIVSNDLNNASAGFSDNTNQLKANDLIVSSDKGFYTSVDTDQKTFSYSYLPLKESFLKMGKEQLTSPRLVDGCNIYRNTNTHFFLDIYYAPEIANRSLKTNDPALQSYVAERTNSEKPILSYSAGLKASIVFSNGLSARIGLTYSNNSERFDYVKETQKLTRNIYDNQGHLIRTEVTELVVMDKIYNQYKFLDVPILLGYEKELKDFVLSVNGGIGLNLSASQTGKIYKDVKNPRTFYLLEDNVEANGPIFNSDAGVSLIGSVGLNYKYNERIMFLFEPSARYYLHSLSNPSNPVSQNYLFLGMNVGIRYRIK